MLLADGHVVPASAFAETTPILSNGWFYGSNGIDLVNLHATYGALYRSQPWVTTVVNKIAYSQARIPLRVWDTSPSSGKVLAMDSPYGKLISKPSSVMSPFAFYRWITSTFEIYGETFVLKVRNGSGRVIDLIPMHPTRTIVKRNFEGDVSYVFSLGVAAAGIITAPEDDVIPFRSFNPDTMLRGMSRLEPLRSTLLNEDAVRRANESYWRKGARPGMVVNSPKALSDEARKRLRLQFDAIAAGVDNFGKSIVLEDGTTASPFPLNLEEMQYIEGRKLNREEVCAVYDIPPPAVHILDHATFSNITENLRSVYRDTMMPRMVDLESILDHYLRPEFDTSGTLEATYSLDEVLRGDFETRATAVQKLVNSGVYTPAEARKVFDLSDLGGLTDRLYANAALVELGTSTKENQTVTQPNLPDALTLDGSEEKTIGMVHRGKTKRAIDGALGSRANDEDAMKSYARELIEGGADVNLVADAIQRLTNSKEI